MKIEFNNLNSKPYEELECGQVFSDLAPYETRDNYTIYLKVNDKKNSAVRLVDGEIEEFSNWVDVYPLDVTLIVK